MFQTRTVDISTLATAAALTTLQGNVTTLLARFWRKAAGAGHAILPAGPAIGIAATSGAANVYGTYVQLRAAAGNAIYITAIEVLENSNATLSYIQAMIGTGTGGSEVAVSEASVQQNLRSSVGVETPPIHYFDPPIAVAAATRIAVKVADDVGAATYNIKLHTIDQANVVTGP